MKKTILGGLAAISLVGLGCVKEMPYNHRDIVRQGNETAVTLDTYWGNDHLRLAVGTWDNGILESVVAWHRYEHAGNGECARIELETMATTAVHMPDGETLEGFWVNYFLNEGCDGVFEGGPDVYPLEQTQQYRRQEYDRYMEKITSNFNVEQLIEDWHRAKGL